MFYRFRDRISQWLRYPQPTLQQQKLLGLYTDSFDLDFVARRLASESSAQYLIDHMRQAQNFETDYDLHEWATKQVSPELVDSGLILEFGVATGRTLNHLARRFPDRTVYGFDSFQGLPEDWTWIMRRGHFQQQLPRVCSNVELVVGLFDQTLDQFLREHTGPIALLHIDSDLYSSAAYVLDRVVGRLRPGTVVIFDEYLNFPGWQYDEHRAWQETVKKYDLEYQYLGFVSRHQQVAIKILEV